MSATPEPKRRALRVVAAISEALASDFFWEEDRKKLEAAMDVAMKKAYEEKR